MCITGCRCLLLHAWSRRQRHPVMHMQASQLCLYPGHSKALQSAPVSMSPNRVTCASAASRGTGQHVGWARDEETLSKWTIAPHKEGLKEVLGSGRNRLKHPVMLLTPDAVSAAPGRPLSQALPCRLA